jgi:hypothetical protein
MLRLDDYYFWQFFDKDHFQFTEKVNCSPAPTTRAHNFGGKISIRLNLVKCRFTQLNKWTFRANNSPWRESPLPLAGRAKIVYDPKLRRGESDPEKPKSL